MKLRLVGRCTQALTAAGVIDPGRFTAVFVPEGERTTDDREIAVGALSWRELPIAFTNAEDVGDDHYGEVVGRIETLERISISSTRAEIRGSGSFDMSTEAGVLASDLVLNQMKRWVSVDMEVIAYDMFEEGDCAIDSTPDSEIDYYPPANCHIIMRVTEGRIMGAALCAFSAFPGAVIVPEGVEIPAATQDGRPAPIVDPVPALVAHAALPEPLAAWFEDPQFGEPGEDPRLVYQPVTGTYACPLTVLDDGRVFGHVAPDGTCHVGYQDSCVTAPRSVTEYAYFKLGATTAAGCDCTIPTGSLTLGGGHADLSLDRKAAAAHYDDVTTRVASITVGDDVYGPWFAGALVPGVTPEQIAALRASSISGDWRMIGGHLELIAVHAVNAPGFPIVRVNLAASGEVQAMVASGAKPIDPVERRFAELERRLAKVERVADPLRGLARDSLAASAGLQ